MALWDGQFELKGQSVQSLNGVWTLTAFMEVKNKYAYAITQDICNKFIEVNFFLDVWFGRDCLCCIIEHLSNIDGTY